MQHCLIIYKPLMISKAGMWDLPSFFGIQIDAGAFSCQLEHSLGVFFLRMKFVVIPCLLLFIN